MLTLGYMDYGCADSVYSLSLEIKYFSYKAFQKFVGTIKDYVY